MAKLMPNDGGCWYCHEDDEKEPLEFCHEFDTYVHKSCIRKRGKEVIEKVLDDSEYMLIALEVIGNGFTESTELICFVCGDVPNRMESEHIEIPVGALVEKRPTGRHRFMCNRCFDLFFGCRKNGLFPLGGCKKMSL